MGTRKPLDLFAFSCMSALWYCSDVAYSTDSLQASTDWLKA